MDKDLKNGFELLGVKFTEDSTYEDIERWLLKTHLICFKPKINGQKLLKFECHPWLINKHEGKVISYSLCKYTGEHKTVFGAYISGLRGALEYLNRAKP